MCFWIRREDTCCEIKEECAATPGIILKSELCANIGGWGLQRVAVTIATSPFISPAAFYYISPLKKTCFLPFDVMGFMTTIYRIIYAY